MNKCNIFLLFVIHKIFHAQLLSKSKHCLLHSCLCIGCRKYFLRIHVPFASLNFLLVEKLLLPSEVSFSVLIMLQLMTCIRFFVTVDFVGCLTEEELTYSLLFH